MNFLDFEVVDQNADVLAKEIVSSMLLEPTCNSLACINPHSYALALNDKNFFRSLHNSDYMVVDGVGIVLCAKLLFRKTLVRITGFEVFTHVNHYMNLASSNRVFFLGSDEHTLSIMKKRFSKDYPNIDIVGSYSPPFLDVFNDNEVLKIAALLDNLCIDALWVGMTAPKQEKLIEDLKLHCNFKWAFAVGAVFDYYSGKLYRPSFLVRRLGLEWLFRFIQQPRKIGSRIFKSSTSFLLYCLKKKLTD